MATKKATTNKTTVKDETKVVCPVCGSEFAIDEHEHTVKNGIAIGKDSGMGTIVLPVSKRGDALKAAGIDTSRYFSIQLPTGGTQMMRVNDDGVPVAVADDDPVVQAIISGGTVPNRSLFRRWVMSQVFRGLTAKDHHGNEIGFTEWMKAHGYKYQWKMLIDELHVQDKLYGKDSENYEQRNRWFNKTVAVAMAKDYIEQLRDDAKHRTRHKCKGVPYITIGGKNVFVSDIEKKLVAPLVICLFRIDNANTAKSLEIAVRKFWNAAPVKHHDYKQCAAWKDAYKGAGAYFTMQNLLRFHGAMFPKDNDFYKRGKNRLQMLEDAAECYCDGEGWRLFGLMKQMLNENCIDIEKKRKEWRNAKRNR